jgi:hypothetical protein
MNMTVSIPILYQQNVFMTLYALCLANEASVTFLIFTSQFCNILEMCRFEYDYTSKTIKDLKLCLNDNKSNGNIVT